MEKSKSISKNNLISNSEHYNFKDRIGEIHITKQGYKIEIIEYFGSSNCTVKFDNGITLYNVHYSNINRGEVGNPIYKSFYNTGYIGIGKHKTSENGKPTKIYSVWKNIMTRGFCIKFKENNPTYKDVTVCEEWHNFQNFAEWFEENYVEGWQLDKDILSNENKIYSPSTSCFVPREVNMLFTKKYSICENTSYISSHGNKFRVKYKNKHLGLFKTFEEALQVYKTTKEKHIKEIANKWREKIKENVYQKMYNYEV